MCCFICIHLNILCITCILHMYIHYIKNNVFDYMYKCDINLPYSTKITKEKHSITVKHYLLIKIQINECVYLNSSCACAVTIILQRSVLHHRHMQTADGNGKGSWLSLWFQRNKNVTATVSFYQFLIASECKQHTKMTDGVE